MNNYTYEEVCAAMQISRIKDSLSTLSKDEINSCLTEAKTMLNSKYNNPAYELNKCVSKYMYEVRGM